MIPNSKEEFARILTEEGYNQKGIDGLWRTGFKDKEEIDEENLRVVARGFLPLAIMFGEAVRPKDEGRPDV